jgi:hypothetical protein
LLEEAMERGDPSSEAVLALEPRIVPEDDVRRFGDPAKLLFNVNTEEDLKRAEGIVADSAARP